MIEASFSGERGATWSAGTRSPRACRVRRPVPVQRQYPQPFKYAPLPHGSYFSETGLEQSQNDVLSGDDVLFVTRLVDLLSNSTPKGGSVQLTINSAAQEAMFDGLRGLGEGVQAAGVAIEPSTGRILATASLPTYDPNELASHDFAAVAKRANAAREGPTQPAQPRDPDTAARPAPRSRS